MSKQIKTVEEILNLSVAAAISELGLSKNWRALPADEDHFLKVQHVLTGFVFRTWGNSECRFELSGEGGGLLFVDIRPRKEFLPMLEEFFTICEKFYGDDWSNLPC